MVYEIRNGGRVAGEASTGGRDGLWTFAAVEERLVEAMRLWRRSSDNEARFSLGGRISSIWRECVDDPLALIERKGVEVAEPRPLPLGRADIARMTEASEWIVQVAERDRKLVIVVVARLASGARRFDWERYWTETGRGKPGPEGLRKRYGRAITRMCHVLNGGNPRPWAVNNRGFAQ